MLSKMRMLRHAAVGDLALALVSLVLIAAGRPKSACVDDFESAPTPLHSGSVVVVTFLGSIVIWLLALGFRLALPPDQDTPRALLRRIQLLCLAALVVSAVAAGIVVGSYACFE